MNEQSFDRRAQAWLDAGPTTLPDDAIALVLDAIADVPQERGLVARLPHRLRASRTSLLATAAAILLVVTAGAALLFQTILPDTVGPRPEDHLLRDFPDVRLLMERAGGPAAADERVDLGKIPGGGITVIAASCEGGEPMTVEVYDPSIELGEPEDGAPLEPEPVTSLDVTCDGSTHHVQVGSQFPTGDLDLVLQVRQGDTWQVAVGAHPPAVSVEPTFAAPVVTEGWYLLMDAPTMLVLTDPGPGIGIQVPDGANEIGVLVQCSGDPIRIFSDASAGSASVDCTDPAAQQRVTFPAEGLGFTVLAGTDGVAWVRMVAEADGDITTARPSAPPLPPELAAFGFAEGDGQHVAFGRLGADVQTVVPAPGSPLALTGGEIAALHIEAADGGSTTLEAWSITDGTRLRPLASTDGNIFQSWVDATHAQAFYGVVMDDGSAEWRRVGLDGSGDTLVVRMDSTVNPTSIASTLAIDDTAFVVEWCPTVGACVRHVHDTATGETREISLAGDRTCHLIGIVDGRYVATSGATCDGPQAPSITVQDLEGGERRPLPVPAGSGVIVLTSTGPAVVVSEDLVDHTIYRVAPVDGSEARELLTIDHPDWVAPQPASLRLPTGWVLLGGPLADTPNNRSTGRAVPLLLNVETGERIELINLPHSAP